MGGETVLTVTDHGIGISPEPALSKIPIVLLTADAHAPEKSRTAGFAGYLMKPVDLDALFRILERYCG